MQIHRSSNYLLALDLDLDPDFILNPTRCLIQMGDLNAHDLQFLKKFADVMRILSQGHEPSWQKSDIYDCHACCLCLLKA